MVKVQKYHHTSDVYEDGTNYLYNMMIDYEKVVLDHGPLSLEDFMSEWNVIPRDAFGHLEQGDIVYDCVGNQYKVESDPWEDDYENLVVEAYHVRPNGSTAPNSDMFAGGDLYYLPHYHDWAFAKPKKPKGDTKICPILITSPVQPQS